MTEKRHQTKIYSYIYNEQYTFTNTFLFSFLRKEVDHDSAFSERGVELKFISFVGVMVLVANS